MNSLRLRHGKHIVYATEHEGNVSFQFRKFVECSELIRRNSEYATFAKVIKVFKNVAIIEYEASWYSPSTLKLMHEASLKLTGKKLPKSKA